MTIQVSLQTETKYVTDSVIIDQPYFGVELIAQAEFSQGDTIYAFTEQEMNELCDAIKFIRTRGSETEVITNEFEADLSD